VYDVSFLIGLILSVFVVIFSVIFNILQMEKLTKQNHWAKARIGLVVIIPRPEGRD